MLKPYIVIVCLIVVCTSAYATTYYVCDTGTSCNANASGWATGSDSNACTGKSAPCKTIRAGVGKLKPGDTVIIGDGRYTGINNMLSTEGWNYDISSGQPNAWITIKAENYLGAIMDGEFNYRPVHLEDERYIIFDSLYLRNAETWRGASGSNFYARYSDHIKVMNMAAENGWGKFWFRYCKYILVENCIAWGKGTYYYTFVGDADDYTASQYNVVRHSIARRDCHLGADGGNHYSSFVTYWGDNTYFQNCLSLDAHPAECGDPDYPAATMAVFYTANGASNYGAEGCISANDEGQIGQFESGASPVTLKNNAAWMAGSDNYGIFIYGPSVVIDGNTFGNVSGNGEYSGQCVRTVDVDPSSLRNNIMYGCEKATFVEVNANNAYNLLYQSGENYLYSTPGNGEVTDVDPLKSGLKYLPRVEDGSQLTSVGQSGGQVGARILKKIGVYGASYGEPGWNSTTGENLWPWPYEQKIKQLMGSYRGVNDSAGNWVAVDGKRGFCADGKGLYGGPITLTSYVWEYLGNPCPAEICSQGNINLYCGDSICSTSENCSTCLADCGSCAVHCRPAEIAPCDGCIDINELSAYLAQWKSSAQITLKQLMDAIVLWKKEC
jgi:hypothetical protein